MVVWIGPTRGFWIYLRGTPASGTLSYRLTTDSGTTWQTAIDIATTISDIDIIACWADWWTPGDTGRTVHIIYDDGADVKYVNFDTVSTLATTPVTVHTMTSASESLNAAIAKMRGGNLVVVTKALSSQRASRSTDGGVTWSSISVPFQFANATGNNIEIYPGNEIDENDCWAVELRTTTGEIPQFIVFTDATDTWIATPFGTAMGGSHSFLSGVISPANNHLLLAICKRALGAPPLEYWDINGSSSIIQLRNIRDDCNGVGAVALAVREDSGRIYAHYPVHTGNTGSFADPAVIKWKFSDDGGRNWITEVTWNEDPAGSAGVDGIWSGGPIPSAIGGRIQPIWTDTGSSGSDEAHTNQVVLGESEVVQPVAPEIDVVEDCPAAQQEVFMDSALTCACQADDTIVSGLSHLEGETVATTVDNATRESQIVLNGRISFPDGIVPNGTGAVTVQVGLPYTTEIETLPLETQDRVSVGKLKRIEQVRMRLHNSRGGDVFIRTPEEDFDAERNITRKTSDPTSAAPPLFSGMVDLGLDGSGDADVRIVIRQSEPQPLTVLAITTELNVDDV